MSVIETQGLWKRYGKFDALKGVSLTVEPRQIYGLIGHNGAGKSTLVKILLGIVQKTDGDARLLGEPVGATAVRRRVGYLPEDHQFPGYHTGRSLLHYYGELYGLTRPERTKRMNEALDIVGLGKRADGKIKTYSKGMKQRLGIAQSFFHDPAVIFLDEPTDGVDPVGRKEIRDLMVALKGEGRTIFVNSHLLAEVEMVADRVAVIHKGEVVREGTVADLTRRTNSFLVGLAHGGPAFPLADVQQLGYRAAMKGEQAEIELAEGQGIDAVLELLWQRGHKLRHLVEQKQSLEAVFMGVVEGNRTAEKAVRKARPVAEESSESPRVARRVER